MMGGRSVDPAWEAAAAACLLTAAGGSMDAWVYIGHGHVFANAQTGNVTLGAIALAGGQVSDALSHLPSLLAFCAGLLVSRLGGAVLKRHGINSRSARLIAEAICLAALALTAGNLGNVAVTAGVGFLAAVQITALSHIEDWSFNTGMTTGNLRSAFSAASAAWLDPTDSAKRHKTLVLGLICLSYPMGATAGAAATFLWRDPALLGTAGAVLSAVAVARRVPDPVP